MRISSNLAQTTTRMITERQEHLNKEMEKLNSGYRVNNSSDDTAGLAISEKMRGQIRGLNVAMNNTQGAISMISTAEGALNETHSILQRIRELAIQGSNQTNVESDRQKLQLEVKGLLKNIDEISKYTNFNTKNLIDGSQNNIKFFIGANKDEDYGMKLNNMSTSSIGIDKLDVSKREKAEEAIELVDKAIDLVGNERSKIGAVNNRLEHTLQNIRLRHDNLADSESRIRDADMAKEMATMVSDKLITQAGIGVQVHANTEANGVLTLLGVR